MDTKREEKLKESWRRENEPVGKMLGYPSCCINEFCEQPPELLRNKEATDTDRLRLIAGKIDGKFTGFIPCKFHAAQILLGNIKVTDLIKDRRPEINPFPYWGHYEK